MTLNLSGRAFDGITMISDGLEVESADEFNRDLVDSNSGHRKIFRLSKYAAIQVAGASVINGVAIGDIAALIAEGIANEEDDHAIISEAALSILRTYFPAISIQTDRERNREFLEAEGNPDLEIDPRCSFLISVWSVAESRGRVHRIAYLRQGSTMQLEDNFVENDPNVIFCGGICENVRVQVFRINTDPGENWSRVRATDLLRRVMEVAIEEEHEQLIPRIGEPIMIAVIDADGYREIEG